MHGDDVLKVDEKTAVAAAKCAVGDLLFDRGKRTRRAEIACQRVKGELVVDHFDIQDLFDVEIVFRAAADHFQDARTDRADRFRRLDHFQLELKIGYRF